MEFNEFKEFSKKLTIEFLNQFPEKANTKYKTQVSQLKNIESEFSKKIQPNARTTMPDNLISEVLEIVYGHERSEREKIQDQYIDQKQAEMMVGALLERYIAEKGKGFGWAFTGTCIRSVDFIRKSDEKWTTLQIKDSDNTENSSSSAIRNNTTILKWSRKN